MNSSGSERFSKAVSTYCMIMIWKQRNSCKNRKISAQAEIEELISKRKTIYGNPEKDDERSKINKRLEKLRKDVRMCKNIEVDSKRISERYKRALELEEDSKRENENKRKGIAYMTKNR